MKSNTHLFLWTLVFLVSGCHSTGWNEYTSGKESGPAPELVCSIFSKDKGNKISISAKNPGFNYQYDIGEKDKNYGQDSLLYRFRTIDLFLHEEMPKGKIIVDFQFKDGLGNKVIVPNVDLLRLTPKIDASGDLIYPELILEEYNRFGVSFRREHNEFSIEYSESPTGEKSYTEDALSAPHRCFIVNNCLAPTKWEFTLVSEDYSDFSQRLKDSINLNQNKLLSHSWFYIDQDLYAALLKIKNPGKNFNIFENYDSINAKAENVLVDFEQLRNPIKRKVDLEIKEIGIDSK